MDPNSITNNLNNLNTNNTNDNLKIKYDFSLEEIFIDFDVKNKSSLETKPLIILFDFLEIKDIISFKNTNQFFSKKINIDLIKKVSKNKILKRKEHLYLMRKIIINQE